MDNAPIQDLRLLEAMRSAVGECDVADPDLAYLAACLRPNPSWTGLRASAATGCRVARLLGRCGAEGLAERIHDRLKQADYNRRL